MRPYAVYRDDAIPVSAVALAAVYGASLTHWKRGHPPEPGVYNASFSKQATVYRYWDGKEWGAHAFTPQGAYDRRNPYIRAAVPKLPWWRGLDRNPEHVVLTA